MKQFLYLLLAITIISCASEAEDEKKKKSELCDCKKILKQYVEEGISLMDPSQTDEGNRRIYEEHRNRYKRRLSKCNEISEKNFKSEKEMIKWYENGKFDCSK